MPHGYLKKVWRSEPANPPAPQTIVATVCTNIRMQMEEEANG